ncbi:MAG TPA: 3'-5' exonuclease [Oligoflexus sp.]|uniref:3'-5' exonuclease n=1 Tax=Oligoflexus sp. TaxID=1971216 RepID=UPI002D5B67B7|nr:3'-5' exonuclease [Oligoflexus sp.]HYX35567.1 3'-5' exonuclease [Oligoflexus sp.]
MTQLQNSMFYDILFPADEEDGQSHSQLFLQKVLRHHLAGDCLVRDSTLVIFDFETTGLDSLRDRIIEVGAIKYQNGQRVADFSTLIKPDIPLPEVASRITGITSEMLENQPSIEDVLPSFLQFIDRSLLVAHNAEFDMAFLKNACHRLGYQIEWSCFCTLKLARQLLPDLESKNLDSLAQHYGLSFAARHRSIGDCEVTGAVLQSLLLGEGAGLQQWKDFSAFQVA